jgi:hypothetical protein
MICWDVHTGGVSCRGWLDDVQFEEPIQPGLEYHNKRLIKTPAALKLNIPIPETTVANDSGVFYYLHKRWLFKQSSCSPDRRERNITTQQTCYGTCSF